MNTTVAIFLDFLYRLNLLQEYFRELRVQRFDDLGESYCKSVFDGDPTFFISSAFPWVKSSSGFAHWRLIDILWLETLNRLK